MFRRLTLYLMFFYLVVALILLASGVHEVSLGRPTLTFIANSVNKTSQYTDMITIPVIPKITESWAPFNWFRDFLNFAIIGVLNIIIRILNLASRLVIFIEVSISSLVEYLVSLGATDFDFGFGL